MELISIAFLFLKSAQEPLAGGAGREDTDMEKQHVHNLEPYLWNPSADMERF